MLCNYIFCFNIFVQVSRKRSFNRFYYPQSTFLQSHTPPVWMKDDVDEYELQQAQDTCGMDVSDTTSVREDSSVSTFLLSLS